MIINFRGLTQPYVLSLIENGYFIKCIEEIKNEKVFYVSIQLQEYNRIMIGDNLIVIYNADALGIIRIPRSEYMEVVIE